MASFFENIGVSLGAFLQKSFGVVADGLKAGVDLWGSGVAEFVEFDGWLFQKAADGIAWVASAGWNFATGGFVLSALEGHDGQGADAAHAPVAAMPAMPAAEPDTRAYPLPHNSDVDVALLVIGLPEMMNAMDWHLQ